MLLFEVNELGLKARLSALLCHSFKHTISYLISFPLRGGKVGMGVDIMDLPPHLNLPSPPSVGEEAIFLTQLGYNIRKIVAGYYVLN